MKLKYDELLSNFAFNFHLRRYIMVSIPSNANIFRWDGTNHSVGQFRLKPAVSHVEPPGICA